MALQSVRLLGKIVTLVFLGGSLFLTAYEHGHIVDIGLGLIIGFLHAKGMIGAINPIAWIGDLFNRARWNMQSRKNEKANARAQAESNQQYEDFREQETRRRQEQAKQKSGSNQRQSNGSSNSNQSQQKRSSNSGYEQYKQSYQEPPKSKPPSERDKALAVLGLEPMATMAEAKRARAKLMSLYHPDKLAGLPEGRRKQAEEETKKINVAWGVISER